MAAAPPARNADEVWKNKAVEKLMGKWLKSAPQHKKQLLASAVGIKSFKKAEPTARMKMFNERSRRLSGFDTGLMAKAAAKAQAQGGLNLEVSGLSLQDASAGGAKKVVPQARRQEKKAGDELFITTNKAFQGAVEGDNFQEILSWARPEPTENLTFSSQWGDALSKGGKDDWWQKYMKSQYSTYNEEVHGPKTDKSQRNSKEFFSWIKRQQLYYNEILTPKIAEEVDAMMTSASPEEKRKLLDLFADLHTVVQPARQYVELSTLKTLSLSLSNSL